MPTFYHGSPTAGLKTLRAGSFITPDLETARLMGRFYPDTGKTWTDDDLVEKHKFGQQPKWKEGREPAGKPHLYQLTVDALDNIDLLDNPYEHTLKSEMPVTPYAEKVRAAVSQAVKQAMLGAFPAATAAAPEDINSRFQPDYTPEQLESLGVYDALYRNKGPRLASQGEWKPEWVSEHDPKGWAQWYKRYSSGRRIEDEDARQIKRWLGFKARHGGPFSKNPTPRRGWALRNWAIDPSKLVPPEQAAAINEMLEEYRRKAMQRYMQEQEQAQQHTGKQADLQPWVQLQPHQQRVADRVSGPNPRMLVYHGLGTGKSLAAIAAAEAAKQNNGGEYAIVAPASLRDNFRKEVDKFTTGSKPEILSYTGLGMGQTPTNNPETLIFDEAHRLRNPDGLAAQAAVDAAKKAPRLALLTGSPITNHPTDLANLLSLLRNEKITPEKFEQKFVDYKKVKPGWMGWLRGVKPGEEMDVKNPDELKSLLRGHVDYNPGKSPEGVDINEQIIDAPMTAEQERIQKAIRTKIPPRFLWKLDKEFPLSRDELSKLNSFLTGMRQISLSTQPFRADKDHFKAFEQSGKLQLALSKLRETLDSDPRRKALIYSNYIDAGLQPYAAALAKQNIPHAIFHGGIPLAERRKALDEYNAGKLRALLIGPAGAEGISTKGTSLIQLLDPHWNETRSQQAKGRGLRFDSHRDLPEELKDVAIQRFISRAKQPGWFKRKVFGVRPERTGDEILDTLAKAKEKANDKFRAILKQVGTESQQEELARKMYEEEGPARKAASTAWAKMAVGQ